MQKIKCVSEAFSMQPKSFWVNRDGITEIKLETVPLGYEYGNPVEQLRYVGYNRDEKVFSLVATAANVQYEAEEKQ